MRRGELKANIFGFDSPFSTLRQVIRLILVKMAQYPYRYDEWYSAYSPYTTTSFNSQIPYNDPPSLSSHDSPSYDSSSSRSSRKSGKKAKEESNAYFLPGHGISKAVILSSYQRLLGPQATIRPFSYQQREGYMITHPGKPLTKVALCLCLYDSS